MQSLSASYEESRAETVGKRGRGPAPWRSHGARESSEVWSWAVRSWSRVGIGASAC